MSKMRAMFNCKMCLFQQAVSILRCLLTCLCGWFFFGFRDANVSQISTHIESSYLSQFFDHEKTKRLEFLVGSKSIALNKFTTEICFTKIITTKLHFLSRTTILTAQISLLLSFVLILLYIMEENNKFFFSILSSFFAPNVF